MNLIKKMSIRNFLMGIVGLMVLVLAAQSVYGFLDAYRQGREIKRINTANAMADHILAAAGEEAKERGYTATALSMKTVVAPTLRAMINDARKKGDAEYAKALTLARTLMANEGGKSPLKVSFEKTAGAYKVVEAARAEVDGQLDKVEKTYPVQGWVKLMTALIEEGADMRLAALTSGGETSQTAGEAMRLNLEVKQAIWLASEYAGRERAAVGNLLSSGAPMDAVVLDKLHSMRTVVDINLRPIFRLRDMNNADPEVLKSITRMEAVFLGSFEQVRKDVYGAGQSGKYPIDAGNWIRESTEGIDSIIGVSHAVSAAVDARYADLAASERAVYLSSAVMGLIILLGVVSLFVIKSKVVTPMRNLNNEIIEIERTGEISRQVVVASDDEAGQIATAFNRMMEKFHNVIREIHASTERLASSSEELSASATQIAAGSESQGARATQVSTSSQEMSTTIIEVARNVSSASDAARDASAVATKGGKIVSRTIESMNGISRNAKESSVLISTLGASSREIGNIVSVINDIADQTNLLALNAAIEAARAGDQGRGFAVVADEVRKLAEKTMTATKEIGAMISTMQNGTAKTITSMEEEVRAVEEGVSLATEAGRALDEIVSKVDVVTSMIHQMTAAMEQQSAVTEQISGDIESVAGVISETTASARQIAMASAEMAELAASLKSTVEIFKVAGGRKEEAKPEKSKVRHKVVRMPREALAAH
ncbi:MAG: HAMP domain-containing protein [Deltaproteobacteria bacterium]|nr:HAMP domain-containing protein [Deltaproteobacteria bacterium]